MKKIIGIVVVLLILSAFFGSGRNRSKNQEQSTQKQETAEATAAQEIPSSEEPAAEEQEDSGREAGRFRRTF